MIILAFVVIAAVVLFVVVIDIFNQRLGKAFVGTRRGYG